MLYQCYAKPLWAFAFVPMLVSVANAEVVLSPGMSASSALSLAGLEEQLFSSCPPFPVFPPCIPVPIATQPLFGPIFGAETELVFEVDSAPVTLGWRIDFFSRGLLLGSYTESGIPILSTGLSSAGSTVDFSFPLTTADLDDTISVRVEALTGTFALNSLSVSTLYRGDTYEIVRLTGSAVASFPQSPPAPELPEPNLLVLFGLLSAGLVAARARKHDRPASAS